MTTGYLTANDVCARYGITMAELWRLRLSNRFPEANVISRNGALWSIKVLDARDERLAKLKKPVAAE